MTAQSTLHLTLLRPCILAILRATGFHATRPAVLDALTDLAARYLLVLAHTTAHHATSHNNPLPTLPDVRAAMQEVGVFKPQMQVPEEWWAEGEDLRGVEAFLAWCAGEEAGEIRRCAGMGVVEDEGEQALDYLTVLKRKHSKTGEESRYQGTLLGKQAEDRIVRIEGGPAETIQAWKAQQKLEDVKEQDAEMREG